MSSPYYLWISNPLFWPILSSHWADEPTRLSSNLEELQSPIDTPLLSCTLSVSVTHYFISNHVSVVGQPLRMSPSTLVSGVTWHLSGDGLSPSGRFTPDTVTFSLELCWRCRRIVFLSYVVDSSFCARPVTILTILPLTPLMTLYTSDVRTNPATNKESRYLNRQSAVVLV